MNVAKLELCHELFDLSGWNKTQNVYAIATGEENKNVSPWLRIGVGSSSAWEELPAYDSGYLLRKLPELRLEIWHNGHVVIKHYTANGVPSKLERLGRHVTAEANTPEDAACKLAIELFKQGILKKEG